MYAPVLCLVSLSLSVIISHLLFVSPMFHVRVLRPRPCSIIPPHLLTHYYYYNSTILPLYPYLPPTWREGLIHVLYLLTLHSTLTFFFFVRLHL